MTETRISRRELARKRAQQIFTGRRVQLNSFRRNLDLPLDDPDRRFIWMLTGQGGIGKTTLLKRYCHNEITS